MGNQTRNFVSIPFVFVVLALTLSAPLCMAEDGPTLPEAAVILDAYVTVTGGVDAYAELNSSVMIGKIEFEGMGISGPIAIHRKRPNKTAVNIETESLGVMQEGVTGEIAWASDTMSGPRLKHGAEHAAAMRDALFDNVVRWREFYQAETVAIEELEGKSCYRVKLTPEIGQPTEQFYNVESGLLVRTNTQMDSPMGLVNVSIDCGDWREVNGVSVPFALEQTIDGIQKVLINVETFDNNTDIADEVFALPDDIKKLLAQQSEKKTN